MKSLIELEALQPTGDLSPVRIKLYHLFIHTLQHIVPWSYFLKISKEFVATKGFVCKLYRSPFRVDDYY